MLVLAPTPTEAKLLMQLSSKWVEDDGLRTAIAKDSFQMLTLGMGKNQTTISSWKYQSLIKESPFVLLTGFCGALSEHLNSGDVVNVSEVIGVGELPISQSLRNLDHVKLISSDKPLATPHEKHETKEKTGGDIVDMEAVFLIEALPEIKNKMQILKVVLDDAKETIEWDEKGRLKDEKAWRKRGAELILKLIPYIQDLRKEFQ